MPQRMNKSSGGRHFSAMESSVRKKLLNIAVWTRAPLYELFQFISHFIDSEVKSDVHENSRQQGLNLVHMKYSKKKSSDKAGQ